MSRMEFLKPGSPESRGAQLVGLRADLEKVTQELATYNVSMEDSRLGLVHLDDGILTELKKRIEKLGEQKEILLARIGQLEESLTS